MAFATTKPTKDKTGRPLFFGRGCSSGINTDEDRKEDVWSDLELAV